jgi:hypothetical protein
MMDFALRCSGPDLRLAAIQMALNRRGSGYIFFVRACSVAHALHVEMIADVGEASRNDAP